MSYPQPAPVPPQPQHAAPTPQKKGMPTWAKVLLIIGILSVVLCGGGFAACTLLVGKAANDISEEQAAKAGHVKLTTCEAQAGSDLFPTVSFDIEVNNSSKNQETYFIDVSVTDASGTRVGNTSSIVSDVRPGQKAVEEGTLVLSQKVSGKITCKIDKVS